MPKDTETIRARFEILAVCMYIMRMKYPAKSVLRTLDLTTFTDYVRWLFGPEVWGEVQRQNKISSKNTRSDHCLTRHSITKNTSDLVSG